MAINIDLTPLLPSDPLTEPSSISQNWRSWKVGLETYLVTLNTTVDMRKRELLLYQAGQATQEIFDTYTETGEDFGMVMTRLDGYFSMKKNVDYVVFQFRQAVQKAGETVNQFATRLRKQAAHCKFSNLERELKSGIIQNCHSKHLRRFAH